MYMVHSISIYCSNGGIISVAGVAKCPWRGKHITNVIVGHKGSLRYSGFAPDNSSDSTADDEGVMEWSFNNNSSSSSGDEDGSPPHQSERIRSFKFENTEVGSGGGQGEGPESVRAFIEACRGPQQLQQFYNGADASIGFKTVATIDAVYRSALSHAMEAVDSLH
jgi:predicted dehydrogenase